MYNGVGDKMETLIEKLDHQARGITHVDGKITFVENALPDEIVDIEIVKSQKKINEAIVKKYIKKSPKRIESICPYYNECGGCDLLHLSYNDQLEYKQNKVIEIMERYAEIPKEKIKSILGSPKNINYRNKVTLKSNGKLGYYKRRTNDIVNIDYCYLANEDLNKEIKELNNFKLDNGIEELMIRKVNDSETSLTVDLRINENDLEKYKKMLNIVPNLSISKDRRLIYSNAKSNIIGKLGNKQFLISPTAFYQVNTLQTENLYNKVLSYVKELHNSTVLDLYCGTGTIGIYISDFAKEVLGVEINSQAIKDANQNKRINGINNINFIAGDTKLVLRTNEFKSDIIIVDPPRAGLDKEVIADLIKISAKKIIYVSCDPITLARDIKLLSEKYEVKEVTPVDMFPNTYHVETVVLMSQIEMRF